MNLLRRIRTALTARGAETYCESCGQVCDADCRAAAIHDRIVAARARALLFDDRSSSRPASRHTPHLPASIGDDRVNHPLNRDPGRGR